MPLQRGKSKLYLETNKNTNTIIFCKLCSQILMTSQFRGKEGGLIRAKVGVKIHPPEYTQGDATPESSCVVYSCLVIL